MKFMLKFALSIHRKLIDTKINLLVLLKEKFNKKIETKIAVLKVLSKSGLDENGRFSLQSLGSLLSGPLAGALGLPTASALAPVVENIALGNTDPVSIVDNIINSDGLMSVV